MKLLLILALLTTSQAYTAKCQSSYKQLMNVNTQIGLENPDSSTMQKENLVWSKEYYKNGKVKYEGYLNKNSIKVGIWTCYDSLGVKISECYWNPKGGKVNTPWKGTQIIWKDDLLTGIENIDLGLLHGERLQFNESGNIKQRDTFKFDELSGIRTSFYDDNNIRAVDTFKYGRRIGALRRWFRNGQEEESLYRASIQLVSLSDTVEKDGYVHYLDVKIKNLTNKFQAVRFEKSCHDMMPNSKNNQNVQSYIHDRMVLGFSGNWIIDDENISDGNQCISASDAVDLKVEVHKIILPPNMESDLIRVRLSIDGNNIPIGKPIKLGLHPYETDLTYWISRAVYFK